MNDEKIRQLQTKAMADLQRDMAQIEARRAKDPLRAERKLFLIELTRARLRKKLSQKELAYKLGMKQSAISRIENGKGNPGLNTLLAITKALDANLVVEY